MAASTSCKMNHGGRSVFPRAYKDELHDELVAERHRVNTELHMEARPLDIGAPEFDPDPEVFAARAATASVCRYYYDPFSAGVRR